MTENENILIELKEILICDDDKNSSILKEKVLSDMIDKSYEVIENITKQERMEFICASYFLFMMHDMKLLKEKLLSRPLKEVQKEILEEFSCMTEIPDTLKSEIAVSTIKENLEILKKQFEKE